jgi:hypothetical protein
MKGVPMYRHPKNWADRAIYRNRLIALPTYYVGKCVIDDGPDAVESYVKATVETTMADAALARVQHLLWDYTRGRSVLTNGGGPGSADYIELHMGKYDGPLAVGDSWRWIVNIGWDEVSEVESPDYFIRLTFGAHISSSRGDEEHLWPYEYTPFGTNPTLGDVFAVCEKIGKYCDRLDLPPVEIGYTV